jgi:hypothetical protein
MRFDASAGARHRQPDGRAHSCVRARNGLILGYLMYRSGLVPRRLAMFGLVGSPLIIISGILVMFGAADQGGTLQALATIPEFIWELGLAIYPIVWGFRAAPILAAYRRRSARRQAAPASARK